MATDVIFPKIGFSMTEGQVAEWMFGTGDEVTEGECLFVLEADKATNEVEAPASGTLTVLVEEGKVIEVGTVIGRIE